MSLVLNNLSFAYGKHKILDNISFEVRSGEIVGLLGPNGAGKSTLMSILCGVQKAQSGHITLDGHSYPWPIGKLCLAPQNFAFYPDLTVAENLHFFAGVQGLNQTQAKSRIDEAVALTCLQLHWQSRAENLSGGWKRRLNLAIALLSNPSVLLLDEPTTGVDPHTRDAILQAILQLKRQGKAIIYTSHYLDEVEKLADTLIIINSGKIQLNDTMSNIIKKYGRSGVLVFDTQPSNEQLEQLAQFAKYSIKNSQTLIQHASIQRVQLQIELYDSFSLSALWEWLTQLAVSPLSMHVGQASLEHLYSSLTRETTTEEETIGSSLC